MPPRLLALVAGLSPSTPKGQELRLRLNPATRPGLFPRVVLSLRPTSQESIAKALALLVRPWLQMLRVDVGASASGISPIREVLLSFCPSCGSSWSTRHSPRDHLGFARGSDARDPQTGQECSFGNGARRPDVVSPSTATGDAAHAATVARSRSSPGCRIRHQSVRGKEEA